MVKPNNSYTILSLLLLTSCASSPSEYRRRLDSWDEMSADMAAQAESGLGQDVDLARLLEYARAHNPGLESAFLSWKEALERVPQSKSLPNPRVSFSAYLSEVETRVGPMQARVSVAQPIPWFGERELAAHMAFEVSEEKRELLEDTRMRLEETVRDAWFEYAWLENALAITRGNRELLQHWESVARSRLETGIGKHADVIRAQVELGKIEDRVQSLADLKRPLIARMNAALGRSSRAELPVPRTLESAPVELDEERLLAELHGTSPALRALGHRIEAARQEVKLAGKAFYPDFFVGADYNFIGSSDTPGVAGSGDDALAVTLGIDLPLWRSSYRAGERAAEARAMSALRELDEMRNRLSAELEMSLYEYRDASRRVELFRESLIPKGEEAVQALDSSYQSGEEGFLDLIDAQRMLLEFQLQAARAVADRARALAEVERICGLELHMEIES